MSDELAIIAKAKENLIYRVSELPISQRIKLSVEKKELIQKCSFNGAACDIDEDFALVFDSEFGNCYTYNHNKSVIKSSLKAGPMYGLRLLLQVNASEYLPTTEAVGVKIVVHGKEEYPFPDSFGYSAPTGYVSSFGMRMQKMYRLPAPFGECTSQKEIDGNSFQGYHYSTEGCYRSCFQRILTEKCGCGEPRLPLIDGTSYCQIFSANDRRCLERYTNELNAYCECHQPCNQSIYSVSYSEARWPSKSLNITVGNCDEHHERCNEYFEENGVMLEVFYEILNFEELREYEAYGVVKMLSDFGGHLGLWSGISFITCCEILLMIAEALYMITERYCRKYRSKK